MVAAGRQSQRNGIMLYHHLAKGVHRSRETPEESDSARSAGSSHGVGSVVASVTRGKYHQGSSMMTAQNSPTKVPYRASVRNNTAVSHYDGGRFSCERAAPPRRRRSLRTVLSSHWARATPAPDHWRPRARPRKASARVVGAGLESADGGSAPVSRATDKNRALMMGEYCFSVIIRD